MGRWTIRPVALGGTDTDGNVHVLCGECHRLKTGTKFGTSDCEAFRPCQRAVHHAVKPEQTRADTAAKRRTGAL
ncbi:HNH endonuclease [Streptomyces sp. ISL-36]|nr:HNH endonuclease signature motif containing protein [Streptomyces sp. ISL-36]MBT2439084.1 HNH endonuclease [Streptomyces sp. ISL-36]